LGLQALGLVTTSEALSSALYIAGLICGLTGVGAWMYFISAYTGRSYHRTRRYRGLAVGVYVGLLTVKLTNPLYGLYVATGLERSPYPHLVVEPQLFYWVSFSLTYTLVAISFYWLLTTLRKSAFPSGSLGALAVLALSPVLPRLAVSALPGEILPPIMLGLSFEPLGVAAFLAGVLVFVDQPFRRIEQSARSRFFQDADDATFVYDTDGKLVEMNTQAQKLRSAVDTQLHTVEAFERAFNPVSDLDGTDPIPIEIDGSTRYVEVRANRMATGAEVVGTVATVRDITERRARKRELESFQRAVEDAADGVAILEDDEYVYVDPTHVEMYGFDAVDDLLGNTWRKLYDDDEIARLENEAFPTLRDDGHWRGMVTGSRPDGSTFPAELSLTIVGDGRLVCTVRDETERLARERELELKERAMDEASVGITISDPDREDNPLIYVNDGFVEQTGYAREEVLGRNCRFLQEDDGDQQAIDELREGIAAEEPVTVDLRNYRKDGEQFWNRLSVTPVYDDGELVNHIGVQQDVTDEVRRKQRLYEERERFRLLTESVDEYAFLVVDEGGIIQTWNAGAENLFGYDAETAIGTSMAELHPESDRASGLPQRLIQQARIAGESADEGWRVRGDGSEFYADVRYAPLESDDGAFRGYSVIVRDMTERRRQQRRTERFVEESEDVVTVLDPNGTITYASGSVERVFGYDPDALVGENLFDYLHPDGREHAMDTFFRCVEDGESVAAECRLKSPDSGWFNVEGQCQNLLDDDAVGGVLVYLRDVTETKERARRFESIFNQTFQFTALLDTDGTVMEVNDAALEFGGFERDDVVGNPFYDARWWTHSETVYDRVQGAIARAASGEFVRYETTVRGANGLATIDFSIKPVRDEDEEITLLVAEGRDITAQQRYSRHLRVMQRVMRHNMRNDLGKVRGWTELMSEEPDAETRAEQFETVETVLDKWEKMIENIKQIKRVLKPEDGEAATMEARLLIGDVASQIREDHENATISTEISDDGSGQVRATLREAVRELVENAVAATEDATVAIDLVESEAEWVRIRVRDDGPGLPEMEADILETGEETPLNHGQGLGLWMVRMIVTQAGGDVSVTTTDGTEIQLRVPAMEVPKPSQ
jgi:PAS domain S-box-containing protein